jgi:TolB protein
MNADGTDVRRIEPEEIIDSRDPAWSPDGSQVAFVGWDGHDDGIFVMDRDGTNVRRLTDGDGDSREPDWSPDGTRIVFVRQHSVREEAHLYIVNSDGTDLRQLTTFPGAVSALAWSPDGTRIAFASDQAGNWEIYVIGSDGTSLVRLTDHPAWDQNPSWSPDGTQITFDSTSSGAHPERPSESELGVFVVNVDGSGLQRATAFMPGDHGARWSPDGEEIAFVHDYEVMVVNNNGNDRRNLTQYPLSDERPRWSPDGREILFLSRRDLWPLAKPGRGRPEPIILRAGNAEQPGGAGASCEWTGNRFQSWHVFGVWLPEDLLRTGTDAPIRLDLSALPSLRSFEFLAYDYAATLDNARIVDGAITLPCSAPGGAESGCLEQYISEAAGPSTASYDLELPPGHYAVVMRAHYGYRQGAPEEGVDLGGYTEQGFNLVVE